MQCEGGSDDRKVLSAMLGGVILDEVKILCGLGW